MTNLSIKFKNFSSTVLALKNNLIIFSYLALVVLIGFEFFVVKQSFDQVLDSNKQQPPSRTVQKVRVNFIDYENNLKRLSEAKEFEAKAEVPANPFKSK
ncbi:MAG: hypothetical protein JNN11_04270 [Candidatus Doudnabacteria bacterium]|nr:hypothetical protein [Candidatus Doudnabacteria bacterium]